MMARGSFGLKTVAGLKLAAKGLAPAAAANGLAEAAATKGLPAGAVPPALGSAGAVGAAALLTAAGGKPGKSPIPANYADCDG